MAIVLPAGISFVCQASQTSALRKKAWLAAKALRRSITCGKIIFANLFAMEG